MRHICSHECIIYVYKYIHICVVLQRLENPESETSISRYHHTSRVRKKTRKTNATPITQRLDGSIKVLEMGKTL